MKATVVNKIVGADVDRDLGIVKAWTHEEKVEANSIFIVIEKALGRSQARVENFPFPRQLRYNKSRGDIVDITPQRAVLF